MDLIKFSQGTKRESDELLEYGNVLNTLSKYGKVVSRGSYKYDLMYGPDIDLVVLSDKPEEASTEALKDFIIQRNFRKYQLGDFIKFPIEGRPEAMIVVLIHEYKGRKWEIEIWFDKEVPKGVVDSELENLLMNVTPQQKETILNLKHQREHGKLSKHDIDSPAIYKGVLLDGKTDITDF